MGLDAKQIDDLVAIAAAGGGFRLEYGARAIDDLVRIAAAAHSGGCRIIMSGMASRPTNDLVRIAAAGQGSVLFE